jgi:hypothetical protein
MRRRTFLQGLGAVTGVAVTSALEPWQRLSAALHQPRRIDRQTVSELEHITISLEGLESQVSPRSLLGPVAGHLNTLATLLQGALKPSMQRQLSSIAGETAGLAGWLAFDMEDRRAAAAYFRAGIEAAQEANDRALGAYLVGSSCVQPAYRERPQARLRRLQGQTFGFQTFDANPSTRAWLITLEAEAHALAGNERAALIALYAADTAMASAAEEDNSRRPRAAFFSPARLVGERGVALARLHQPQAASRCLSQPSHRLTPRSSRPGRDSWPPLPPPTSARETLTRPAALGARPLTLLPASRSRPTSRTYAGSAWTWSPGARRERSGTWTSSSPLPGRNLPLRIHRGF